MSFLIEGKFASILRFLPSSGFTPVVIIHVLYNLCIGNKPCLLGVWIWKFSQMTENMWSIGNGVVHGSYGVFIAEVVE